MERTQGTGWHRITLIGIFFVLSGCTQDVVVVDGCRQTLYGCCPDGTSPAQGANFAGCNITRKVPECDLTPYQCCPDGHTVSTGEDTGTFL